MDYPNVDRPHIVPRGLLDAFAVDGLIALRLRGVTSHKIVSTRDAGVCHAFYSRQRPDGSRLDDIEWSLGQVENRALPVLNEIESRWPLSLEDKTLLAELFALQLLRGPRWKEWHEQMTRTFVADYRQTPEGAALPEIEVTATEHHLLSSTQRMTRMLSLAAKVTAGFASMHWMCIDFPRPWLAISDHPVVMWPLEENGRQPQPTRLNAGVLQTLEVRVSVAPTRAILMTWADVPEPVQIDVPGARVIDRTRHRPWLLRLGAGMVVAASRELCAPSGDGRN